MVKLKPIRLINEVEERRKGDKSEVVLTMLPGHLACAKGPTSLMRPILQFTKNPR